MSCPVVELVLTNNQVKRNGREFPSHPLNQACHDFCHLWLGFGEDQLAAMAREAGSRAGAAMAAPSSAVMASRFSVVIVNLLWAVRRAGATRPVWRIACPVSSPITRMIPPRGRAGDRLRKGGQQPGADGPGDVRGGTGEHRRYSHSIVAGGLLEMSYTTRFTPRTSDVIRDETAARKSWGSRAQSAVIPSVEVTARKATVFSYVRKSPMTPTDWIGRRTANACHTSP